jgi:predicted RNA-binding Zn ribbon-like protein
MSDDEVRDGFRFRSCSVPLDFTSTRIGRLREPRELLQKPGDLARWLVAAGVTNRKVSVSAEELEEALALREALYRLAFARAHGAPYPPKDRALLNRWASRPAPTPRLEPKGLRWTAEGVEALLSAVARDAVELFGGELGDRIRQCAGDRCATLFVDTSRCGDRKWCSMAACGNKAKVAAFREAQRKS